MANEFKPQAYSHSHADQSGLRAITPELRATLDLHRLWLQTNGKEGQRADLEGCFLTRFDLRKVQLSKGNLQETYLDEADLSDAQLVGADLRNANFAGARLHGANLRDANLIGALHLQVHQLARSDLTQAKLPADVAQFEDLDNLSTATRNTARVFLFMIVACIFSWLTVANTTDVGLLTNTAISTMPVIGTSLPIVGFYIASPIALLAIYIYFHINWTRLWEGLALLPAVFPDGRRLDQAVYPWLLNGLIFFHFRHLRSARPPFAWIQLALTIGLGWVLVPYTISEIWFRYLSRQDWFVTFIIIMALTLASWLMLHSFCIADCIFRNNKRLFLKTEIVCVGLSCFLFFCLLILSYGSMHGFPNISKAQGYQIVLSDKEPAYIRTRFGRFANLRESDVSVKPANWSNTWNCKETELYLVKGAFLRRRNLRYANAQKAFLVNADLQYAQLPGADLEEADLRLAHLAFANLQQANLIHARLDKAKLGGANLQGACLWNSFLKEVDFNDPPLGHELNGNIFQANLQGALLREAYIEGANFIGVRGLTEEQVRSAYGWPLAYYGPDLLVKLGFPENHYSRVKGKDLSNYNLQRADFNYSDLQGFNLSGADLQDSDFYKAKLKGADLRRANLQGAKNITEEQIASTITDEATLLPAHLKISKLKKLRKLKDK